MAHIELTAEVLPDISNIASIRVGAAVGEVGSFRKAVVGVDKIWSSEAGVGVKVKVVVGFWSGSRMNWVFLVN